MAALIARLLRKKAAANVAAKNVGKVRMMTPGEMIRKIRIRFRILPATGGEIGFRIDVSSISTRVTKKVAPIQQPVLCGIDAIPYRKNKNASS